MAVNLILRSNYGVNLATAESHVVAATFHTLRRLFTGTKTPGKRSRIVSTIQKLTGLMTITWAKTFHEKITADRFY